MKKIPTIFTRDWLKNPSAVIDQPHPDCAWVFAREGTATRKLDGTSCLVAGGELFRRREIKAGQPEPAGFVAAGLDNETGKSVGWVPVGDVAEDRWHREAFASAGGTLEDGTYELLGPKIQGNPEQRATHVLAAHVAAEVFGDAPVTFDALRAWLSDRDMEGLVWHHPDGRMGKIKLRDFGLKRPK